MHYKMHKPFICVDDDFVCDWMMYKERGTEAISSLVNPVLPLRKPKTLKCDESCGQPVVNSYDPSKVTELVYCLVVPENLHGVLDTLQ